METLLATPSELHLLEERYLGKFSAYIRTVVHILQFTCPDLMYHVNCISIHTAAPSASAFQDITHLIRYLVGCARCPIMYPYGLYSTTTHDICKEVYPGDFHSQKISNGVVYFAYGGEVRAPNDKCAIAYTILCLFGIVVRWSAKNQPSYLAHST